MRFAVDAPPARVTFCHCRFCQRATGSAYLVEPLFEEKNFSVKTGKVRVYQHRSTGSGKLVYIHFCENCGTKLFLTFERFAATIGVYGGTFDDPNWFDRSSGNSKHIFMGEAQHGTIIPAGMNSFQEHAMMPDGTPIEPTLFTEPEIIKTR
ncbi:MAG: GFA family protein [Rhodospirillales bacterium]